MSLSVKKIFLGLFIVASLVVAGAQVQQLPQQNYGLFLLADLAGQVQQLPQQNYAGGNTAGGGGNVSNSGTPSAGQFAQWVDATHIAGVSGVTPVASGTAALGTGAITSGSCATVVTVSATGVLTTDVITVGFNGDPTAVTGYGVSATGAVVTIYPYPTANNVNFEVCNSSSGSITPGALTLNWKVVR